MSIRFFAFQNGGWTFSLRVKGNDTAKNSSREQGDKEKTRKRSANKGKAHAKHRTCTQGKKVVHTLIDFAIALHRILL